MDLHEISAQLLSSESLRARGVTRSARRAAVSAGRLVAVHRGWYVTADVWQAWHVESRHAAQSLAAAYSMRGDGAVLSHTSAAVLHGLPLFRLAPRFVHVIDSHSDGIAQPTERGTSTSVLPLARHAVELGADGTEVDGIAVTSLERTVGDLIGRTRPETAIALADAALRLVAWDAKTHTYDEAAAEAFRQRVRATPGLQRGQRGVVQARWILDFADGRAQLPGESVSRLYLHLLGFGAPRLQVRVEVDEATWYLDFGFDDADAWGEFDGEGKYIDAELTGGASPLEVLRAEKQREDSIRAATGRSVVRWGMKHLVSSEALRTQLARYGVRPPVTRRTIPSERQTADV